MRTPNRNATDILLTGMVIAAVVLFGPAVVAIPLMWLIGGLGNLPGQVREGLEAVGWRINLILAAIVGAMRFIQFHPIGNPKYNSWLKTTPWHSGKTLPLGPVQLLPVEWLL